MTRLGKVVGAALGIGAIGGTALYLAEPMPGPPRQLTSLQTYSDLQNGSEGPSTTSTTLPAYAGPAAEMGTFTFTDTDYDPCAFAGCTWQFVVDPIGDDVRVSDVRRAASNRLLSERPRTLAFDDPVLLPLRPFIDAALLGTTPSSCCQKGKEPLLAVRLGSEVILEVAHPVEAPDAQLE